MQLGGGGRKPSVEDAIRVSIEWAKERCASTKNKDTVVNEVEYRFLLQTTTARENAISVFAERPALFDHKVNEYLETHLSPDHRIRLAPHTHQILESIQKTKLGVHYPVDKPFLVAHASEMPVALGDAELNVETCVKCKRDQYRSIKGNFTVDISSNTLEIEVSSATDWDALTPELLVLSVLLRLRKFEGKMPRAFTKSNAQLVSARDYVVSIKYDGLRVLVCGFKGVDFLLLLTRNLRVTKLVALHAPLATCYVLDAEWCVTKGQCMLFDVFELNHCADVNTLPLQDRLVLLQHLADRIKTDNPCFRVKRFFSMLSPEHIGYLMTSLRNPDETLPNDGLIFTPKLALRPNNKSRKKTAMEPKIYKWKPIHRLTLDFRLIEDEEASGFALMYAERDGTERRYKQYTVSTQDPTVLSGHIVECSFDLSTNSFRVLSHRTDKDRPNYIDVVEDTMSCIEHPLYDQDMEVWLRQKAK